MNSRHCNLMGQRSAWHHWWVEAVWWILSAADAESKLICIIINPHIVHGPTSLSCFMHVIWNEQKKSNIRVACGQRERHTHFSSTCRALELINPSSFQFICLSSTFFCSLLRLAVTAPWYSISSHFFLSSDVICHSLLSPPSLCFAVLGGKLWLLWHSIFLVHFNFP